MFLTVLTYQLFQILGLSQRHVDTYRRARPYLSPTEDARERLLDAQRRAAQADVARLAQTVRLYLQALGRLAQDDVWCSRN